MIQAKEKPGDLIVGKMYKVWYMPTKYLYERCGKLLSVSDTHLKFAADYDGWYFTLQIKHLINIERDDL